jgi:hypothetical protein
LRLGVLVYNIRQATDIFIRKRLALGGDRHAHGLYYTRLSLTVSSQAKLPERWQWLLGGAIAILISLLALWIGFNLRTNSTITGRSLKIGSTVLMGTVFLPMGKEPLFSLELLVDASTSVCCLETPSQLSLIKAPK